MSENELNESDTNRAIKKTRKRYEKLSFSFLVLFCFVFTSKPRLRNTHIDVVESQPHLISVFKCSTFHLKHIHFKKQNNKGKSTTTITTTTNKAKQPPSPSNINRSLTEEPY
jgi:hypothetical protein